MPLSVMLRLLNVTRVVRHFLRLKADPHEGIEPSFLPYQGNIVSHTMRQYFKEFHNKAPVFPSCGFLASFRQSNLSKTA